MIAKAASSPACRPNVIVPRQASLTRSPVFPRCFVFIGLHRLPRLSHVPRRARGIGARRRTPAERRRPKMRSAYHARAAAGGAFRRPPEGYSSRSSAAPWRQSQSVLVAGVGGPGPVPRRPARPPAAAPIAQGDRRRVPAPSRTRAVEPPPRREEPRPAPPPGRPFLRRVLRQVRTSSGRSPS